MVIPFTPATGTTDGAFVSSAYRVNKKNKTIEYYPTVVISDELQ